MKGVLIRPFRLIRRFVVIAALGIAAYCVVSNTGTLIEAIPKIGDFASDAAPKIGEAVKEHVAPAFASAFDEVVSRLYSREVRSADAGSAAKDPEGENVAGETQNGEQNDAPAILRRNPDEPTKLALTFDDGPHPTHSAAILDLLDRYGVKATFFVIGQNAAKHPELIERELACGHEVQNHTMTHASLSRLSYRDVLTEVTDAEQAIYPDGTGRSTLLRPPGGAVSQTTLRLAKRLGLSIVLWSVDTRDWEHKDADTLVKTVRENVKGGDVILFHDFISGKAHTLEALETLIPELLSEGYEFVTVSELFGLE